MDSKELRGLMEAYSEVYAPQEVEEAVKGESSETRRDMAAERRRGIKPLPAKEGERYANWKMGQIAYAKRRKMGEEIEEVGEEMKPLPKNKMFRKAGNLGRDIVSPATGDEDRQKKYDRQKKIIRTLNKANEEFDVFDTVLEFLYVEGYVDTLEEAEWVMANLIDEEAVDIILGEEQLDEISQKTATRAYAASRTGEFEGADSDRDLKRSDNLEKHIKRKFGDKAVKHAERAAEVQTFGRKDASGRRKQSPQPRIQTSDHENQREFKRELRIRRDRRLRAKEDVNEADSVAKMRERSAKRRQQRYGKQGGGGYDYYKPLTQADYERGEKNDPRKKVKNEAFDAWLDEAMSNYEKNRKRAAQRAAARNAARDAGKTGVVPGVGYVSPRRERETWTDESGKTRHAKGL